MQLQVQKYLRSGKTLEELKSEHGICYSTYENLVNLNYDQLNCVKTEPIVTECRALILEKDTWDIVSMGFIRFFNYGECNTQSYDYSKFTALSKIDGSYISVFNYKDKWLYSTRSVIENNGKVGFLDMTFKQLFDKVIAQYPNFYQQLDKNLIYTFELTSPENKVVRQYKDRALTLLTVRDKLNDFAELPLSEVQYNALLLGVNTPKTYEFTDIYSLLQLAAGLKDLDEGFVCVDYTTQINGSHQRVKVKNPAYVAIAHIKEASGSSLRAIMNLIRRNEQDEFLSYFPEYKTHIVKMITAYYNYLAKIDRDLIQVEKFKKDNPNFTRKDYALFVKDMTNSGVMFMALDGKINNSQDWINVCIKTKGEKNTDKFLLEVLKIKDMSLEV